MKPIIHIYLDFNGVLDSSRGHYGGTDFDPYCVEAYNAIVEHYDPQIIVISSWRYSYSLEKLAQILQQQGLRGTVIGKTDCDHLPHSTRGDEIVKWRTEHADVNTPMLVLEDMMDIAPFDDRCIRPKPRIGLHFDDVPQAIKILNSQIHAAL